MPLTRPNTGDPFDSGGTKSSTLLDEYADAIEALQAVDAIPQGGPLSEDLISDDKKLKGADDASATGGYILAHAGDDAVSGGEAEVDGGDGATGKPGGLARLQGGFGDAGTDSPSSVVATGGDGEGGDGWVEVVTHGQNGSTGEALMSDGSGGVTWDTPGGAGASGGTPALTFDSSAAAGDDTTFVRTDDQLALFDATNPSTQAFGDSAAVGSAGKAARRDHKHAMPANPVTAHEAASDPHTGYQKESEKSAASGYASLDSGTKVPTAELGSGSASSSTFLRGDQTWAAPAGGADSRLVISGKTADEGPLSSTVLQDDDHISFAIGANEIWAFYLFFQYTETASGNAKWRLDGPSGVAGTLVNNAATHLAPLDDPFAAGAQALTGGAGVYQRHGYIVNGGTGGTIKLQWAQNTASGSLSVKKGSHLIAHKIA